MSKDGNSTMAPQLRFPEFRDSAGWEASSIGEHVDLLSGYPFDGADISEDSSGNRLLRGINITEGTIRHSREIDRYYVGNKDDLTKFELLEDDLVIGMDGSKVGKNSALISSDDAGALLIQRVARLRTNDCNLIRFIFLHINSSQFHRYVDKINTSSGIPHISAKQIRDFTIWFPSTREQQKIAECLTSLDQLIAAQGRKVEALKVHRRGLMQRLFPRENETIPRLRFPEFRDAPDWKARLLDDFIFERSEIADGTTPLFSLTIEDGVTAKTDRYERSFLVTSKEDAYKLVLPNDFAFNPMNLRFGAIGRHVGAQPVALSKYYNIFYCDSSVNSRFCEMYFRSDAMVAFYDVMATGTLIEKRRVHFDRFLKFSIPFPIVQEQQRIADCLSFLDAQIVAESERLGALKTHKKGLMQQLLPSVVGA